ncbi:MAG: recombinase family protein [Phascolarctobacterium sp.]|nr:recombinase family protein [Candidatus Phascolarctobacterium caballi]
MRPFPPLRIYAVFDGLKTYAQNYLRKRVIKITVYGYARVSTSGQQLKGNSLDDQVRTLKQNGAKKIFKEAFTGSTTRRPKLIQLVDKVKAGDTIIVTKLDRLARNVQEGIQMVSAMFKRGVSVHVLNIGLLEDTAMGHFFLTTLLAVAELERNMIIERTQAGKAIARTKEGYREGRRPLQSAKITYALELLKTHTYKEVVEITGISKATLARYKAKELP